MHTILAQVPEPLVPTVPTSSILMLLAGLGGFAILLALFDFGSRAGTIARATWKECLRQPVFSILTAVGSLVIIANMIVALLVAHTGDLFHLNKQGGYQLELQAMYLFTAVALALTGAGRYSVGGRYGPLN